MTLRHKLADWISGGELTRLNREFNLLEEMSIDIVGSEFDARNALHQIIAQETPSANATVRRMARIAREALE